MCCECEMKCELSRPKTNLQKIITILYGPACKMVVLSYAPIVIMLLSFLYWAILKSILCSLQYKPNQAQLSPKALLPKSHLEFRFCRHTFLEEMHQPNPHGWILSLSPLFLVLFLGGSGGGGSGGGVRTLLIMIKSCYDHAITNTGKPLCVDTLYARIWLV